MDTLSSTSSPSASEAKQAESPSIDQQSSDSTLQSDDDASNLSFNSASKPIWTPHSPFDNDTIVTLSPPPVNSEILHQLFYNLLRARNVDESKLPSCKLLAARVAGSRAFNLANPETADYDVAAIFICTDPTTTFIRPIGEAVLNSMKAKSKRKRLRPLDIIGGALHSAENEEPDICAWEIRKFKSLVDEGSIPAMELFWSKNTQEYNEENKIKLDKGLPIESRLNPPIIFRSPEFQKLVEMRQKFLSKLTIRRYHSFACNMKKQIYRELGRDILRFNKIIKKFYHSYRLIYEAVNLIHGNSPIISFPDGHPWGLFLLEIRKLAFTFSTPKIKVALPTSPLLTLPISIPKPSDPDSPLQMRLFSADLMCFGDAVDFMIANCTFILGKILVAIPKTPLPEEPQAEFFHAWLTELVSSSSPTVS